MKILFLLFAGSIISTCEPGQLSKFEEKVNIHQEFLTDTSKVNNKWDQENRKWLDMPEEMQTILNTIFDEWNWHDLKTCYFNYISVHQDQASQVNDMMTSLKAYREYFIWKQINQIVCKNLQNEKTGVNKKDQLRNDLIDQQGNYLKKNNIQRSKSVDDIPELKYVDFISKTKTEGSKNTYKLCCIHTIFKDRFVSYFSTGSNDPTSDFDFTVDFDMKNQAITSSNLRRSYEDSVFYFKLAHQLNMNFKLHFRDNSRDMGKIVDSNIYPNTMTYYELLFKEIQPTIKENLEIYKQFRSSLDFNICIASVLFLIEFLNNPEKKKPTELTELNELLNELKEKLFKCQIYDDTEEKKKTKILKVARLNAVKFLRGKTDTPLYTTAANSLQELLEAFAIPEILNTTEDKLDLYLNCYNTFDTKGKSEFVNFDATFEQSIINKVASLDVPREENKWDYYSRLATCNIWLIEGYQTLGAIENINAPFSKTNLYNCRNLAETFLENFGMLIVHVLEEYNHYEDKANWFNNRNISDKFKYLVRSIATNTIPKCISFGDKQEDWYNKENGVWYDENQTNADISNIINLYQNITREKINPAKKVKDIYSEELIKLYPAEKQDGSFVNFVKGMSDILIDYRDKTIVKLQTIYPFIMKNNNLII